MRTQEQTLNNNMFVYWSGFLCDSNCCSVSLLFSRLIYFEGSCASGRFVLIAVASQGVLVSREGASWHGRRGKEHQVLWGPQEGHCVLLNRPIWGKKSTREFCAFNDSHPFLLLFAKKSSQDQKLRGEKYPLL
jgi:hypothetical protein